jgi:hypothetical protein
MCPSVPYVVIKSEHHERPYMSYMVNSHLQIRFLTNLTTHSPYLSHIINLFGNGIRYWVCDLDAPEMEPLIALKLQRSLRWDQVLFDLSLLNRHGIDHWSSLSCREEKFGFMLTDQNRLEIKKGSKLVLRFHSVELYDDVLLFPRFRSSILPATETISPHLMIFQFETGSIGKFRIDSDEFNINDLIFNLEQPLLQENDLLLTGITYQDKKLENERQDTVVRGLRVVEF